MDPVGLKQAAKTVDATAHTIANEAEAIRRTLDEDIRLTLAEFRTAVATVKDTAEAFRQSVDLMTVTINASVENSLALARRLDGAKLKLELAPAAVPGTE